MHLQSSAHIATTSFVNLLSGAFSSPTNPQYPVLRITTGHRTNLVTPELAPSTGFSTSECETSLRGSLTSASVNSQPASDDQKLQERNMAVLEVRRADYAKLIRDFKEGRAESQSFPPELQAKPRKLQDELTGANSNFHNEITSVDV